MNAPVAKVTAQAHAPTSHLFKDNVHGALNDPQLQKALGHHHRGVVEQFPEIECIGTAKVQAQALLTFAAWNLTRMMTLLGWRESTGIGQSTP